MKIRRHMHPDHIPALARQHRGNGIPANSHRPTREKMGSSYGTFVKRSETSRPDDLVFRPLWGKVYNHNGEVIDPIAIQAKVNERTAMTASVQIGKSVTLERKFGGFVTVDATDAKAIMVWAHPKKVLSLGIAPTILGNLKDARRFVRSLLDPTPLG